MWWAIGRIPIQTCPRRRRMQVTLQHGGRFHGVFSGGVGRAEMEARPRRYQALGPIICSGRTTASKVASSTKPNAMASSFSVVPFLCAVLATLVALS